MNQSVPNPVTPHAVDTGVTIVPEQVLEFTTRKKSLIEEDH